MKKWQLGFGIVTLSFGLGLALNSSSNTHAAAWHNGVPRFLRGTWKNTYNGFHFYKNSYVAWNRKIGYVPTAYSRTHVKYKVVGKYRYELRYFDLRNENSNTRGWYTLGPIKYVNHNKIRIGSYLYRY